MEQPPDASADWLTNGMKQQNLAAACASQTHTYSSGLAGCSLTHEMQCGPASAGAKGGTPQDLALLDQLQPVPLSTYLPVQVPRKGCTP